MPLKRTLAAAGVLRRRLGLRATLKIAASIRRQQKAGLPWSDLPPPETEKDAASRAQVKNAILAYRALKDRLPPAAAEAVLRELVTVASVAHLRSSVPRLREADLLPLTQAQRENKLGEMVTSFPNSEWKVVESTPTSFIFRVHRCRFTELLPQVGHPEIADAFCAGDILYFQQYQPEVQFERPCSIGGGAKYCDFIFKLREKAS